MKTKELFIGMGAGLALVGVFGAIKKAQAAAPVKRAEEGKSAEMRKALEGYFAQSTAAGRALWFEQIKNTFFLDQAMAGAIIAAAAAEDTARVKKGLPPIYPGSQNQPVM